MKVRTERNLKSVRIENCILYVPLTSNGHNFFIQNRNSEIYASLESLGNAL
jgi:hypothetical protein